MKPILFSTPMVQAILEGRKTMTRRIVKQAKGWDANWKVQLIDEEHYDGIPRYEIRCGSQYVVPIFKCPYGQPGDILWVRESFVPGYFDNGKPGYKADWNKVAAEYMSEPKWKPSIHMPFAAARIFLKIKSVRVEKLQDISEADAKAEGAKNFMKVDELKLLTGLDNWIIPSPFREHQFGFLSIWCKINGCESWIANPWVWVVEFERVEKPL